MPPPPPATVLTCGQLRLRLPAGAGIPAVRMRPAAVEVHFENFSGTVLFEPVDDPAPDRRPPSKPRKALAKSKHKTAQKKLPRTPSLPTSAKKTKNNPTPTNTHKPNPLPDQIPHPVQEDLNPTPSSPLPPTQPPLSQPLPPLSQPINLSQPIHPIHLSQPLHFAHANPFSLSQLPSQALQSQPLFDPPFPASQLPDGSLPPSDGSLPPSADPPASADPPHPTPVPSASPPSPPPMADQFTSSFMPLTPPSSDDDNDHHLLDTHIYSPPDIIPPPPPTNSTKRTAPDFSLAVKTGKRVRFQSDPEVFSPLPHPDSEPTKDRASEEELNTASPKSVSSKPSPWSTLDLDATEATPGRRWGMTFTRMNDNTVVLLGGENEVNGFYKEMAMLNVAQSRWVRNGKDTPDMPDAGRAWHTTTCVDVNLFVFGGEKGVMGERTQTNDALMYDATYYTWYPPALSGKTPVARAGHCAALLPGTKNIVIYGGINGNRWLNDLHLLEDLSTWSKVRTTTKCARPSARSYATLTAAGGFLVLFGGNNKTKSFNDVHVLNGKDLSWVEPVILGRAPKPRTGHCAVASRDGQGVVVYGGWDDQGAKRLFYSDVWELRIKSQTECQWTCLFGGDNACRVPGPRAGAALEAAGDESEKKMLLFGGWHQFTYFNDVTELVLPFKRKCAKSNLAS